ncbi:hypothetical protein D3C76_1526590 [compost metagenome]
MNDLDLLMIRHAGFDDFFQHVCDFTIHIIGLLLGLPIGESHMHLGRHIGAFIIECITFNGILDIRVTLHCLIDGGL